MRQVRWRLSILFERACAHGTTTSLSVLALAVVLCCSGLELASASKTVASSSAGKKASANPREHLLVPLVPQATPALPLVRRGQLWPQLRDALKALGDRLEKPGKERVIAIGTLSRLSGSQTETVPFRLITEFPNRMRLEEQSGGQTRITGFNGRDGWKVGGTFNRADQDTIETLVFDCIDHFFDGQMRGFPTRFLGSRFRLDDGKAANYAGPFYDIYQVADQVSIGQSSRVQPKLYHLNSKSLLLERVHYRSQRDSSEIDVETQIKEWRAVNDHRLPVQIARLENGQQVLTLTIVSVALGGKADDGIFDPPGR